MFILLYHKGLRRIASGATKLGSILYFIFMAFSLPVVRRTGLGRQAFNWQEDVHRDPSKPSTWDPIPAIRGTSSVTNHRQLMVVTNWSDLETH